MTAIKVCGMTQREEILALARLKIDYAGLIFYKKSPRYVGDTLSPDAIKTINNIKKVGVFVNADKAYILKQIERYGLDLIQLHGEESPEMCRALNAVLPVIKAFKVDSLKTVQHTKAYHSCCTYFLFDTAGKHYGGNGKTFDWTILKAYTGETPFFLSGGIGPHCLSDLNQFHHPARAGIDLNSRFETAPGKKRLTLLNHFLCQLRIE